MPVQPFPRFSPPHNWNTQYRNVILSHLGFGDIYMEKKYIDKSESILCNCHMHFDPRILKPVSHKIDRYEESKQKSIDKPKFEQIRQSKI